jgi:flagellar biosynthesis/type III secretory pathway protein FliH
MTKIEEMIEDVKNNLNDGEIVAPDELVVAIAELWELAPRLARIIEKQSKDFCNTSYNRGYDNGFKDGSMMD